MDRDRLRSEHRSGRGSRAGSCVAALLSGAGGRENERTGATEAQDIYGTRILLTREGLTYGKQFVPFDEIGGMHPALDTFWNPGTNLFEVTVFRRNGPDLVIKNLPLQTADRLREAIIDALRERYM